MDTVDASDEQASPTGRAGGERSARGPAIAAAAGCLATAAFEVALALGAPFGRAAWGGQQTEIGAGLRVASFVAAGLWVVAAAVVLKRGGIRVNWPSAAFARRGIWVLTTLLGVGTLMNAASRSDLERGIWAPAGLVMTVLCLVVARRANREERAQAATP